MEKLVIIPTYNERENIEPMLEKLLALPHGLDVLVVDDNSPDGTAGLVEEWQKKSERVHLLKRPGKMGLGSAYRDGFRYALKHGAEYIFEMDADFSHDPDAIGEFLAAAQDVDAEHRTRIPAAASAHDPAERTPVANGSSADVA